MFPIKNQMLALAGLSLIASASSAFAITLSNPVAASPSVSGNGLLGSYYGQVSNGQIRNGHLVAPILTTNGAMDYISENKPVAVFQASGINYPGNGSSTTGDTATLGAFLGTDAVTLSKPDVANNGLSGQLFDFKGYINVQTARTYTFSLGSDDGARLLIGGKTIVDRYYLQNVFQTGYVVREAQVTFTEAGLYPIEVAYFENTGRTGISLSSDLSSNKPSGMLSPITPASFYSPATAVPEPGSVALLIGAGTLACGLIPRKRK